MDENLDETLDLSKIQDLDDFDDVDTEDNKLNASVQLRSELPPIGDLPTFSQKRKKASQKRRKQLIAGVMIGLSVVGIGAGAITSLMNNHRTADSVQPVSEKINGDKSDKDKTAKAVLDGSYKNKKKSMEKTEKENKEDLITVKEMMLLNGNKEMTEIVNNFINNIKPNNTKI